MSKFFILIVSILYVSNVIALEPFIGHFSTVTESACNYEIEFALDNQGIFKQTCRREDGSHIDDVKEQNLIWSLKDNVVSTTINGSDEHFEYIDSLSCSSFGSKGASDGLLGFSMQFWRVPIRCK